MTDEVVGTNSEFPKKAKMGDIGNYAGHYFVVWRKQSRQAAKVIGVEDDPDGKRTVYELLTDPEKGVVKSAKFDPAQEVLIYDEGTKVMALLDK